MDRTWIEYINALEERGKPAPFDIRNCKCCNRRIKPIYRMPNFTTMSIPNGFWAMYFEYCLTCIKVDALLPSIKSE